MENETYSQTLADVAGYEEEKALARRIITVFQKRDECKKKGIEIPKGLIINGAPGIGKTLLAHAIIHESGVPCFALKRQGTTTGEQISELFQEARKHSPSIIFLDEIDNLVPQHNFMSDVNTGAMATLLREMDGTNGTDGIMVLGTCNNKRGMPYALIRNGRIDKKIDMEAPNLKARKAILDYYLGKYKDRPAIDIASLADSVVGFTGADIKTLVNEVMTDAFLEGKVPSLIDFEKAIPSIRFENLKKNDAKKEKHIAVHEVGHFAAQFFLTGSIGAVSVERYGMVQGHNAPTDEEDDEEDELYIFPREGTIAKPEEGEKKLDDVERQKAEIIRSLAGLAAEEVILGKRHLGAKRDIDQAEDLIEGLARHGYYGLGICAYCQGGSPMETPDPRFLKKISKELEKGYRMAKRFVRKHRAFIQELVPVLLEREYLSKKELQDLLVRGGYLAKSNRA